MRDGFRRLSIAAVGAALVFGLAAASSVDDSAVTRPVTDASVTVTKFVDATVHSAPARSVMRAPVVAFLALAAGLALALLYRGQSEVGLVRVRVERERRAGPRAPPR